MSDMPRVSYLGPEATFTHEAAILRFGEGAVLTPEPSIDAVFDEVEGRRSRWGVVPTGEHVCFHVCNLHVFPHEFV